MDSENLALGIIIATIAIFMLGLILFLGISLPVEMDKTRAQSELYRSMARNPDDVKKFFALIDGKK